MQKELDIAVVGSGIGGSLISALNSHKDLILFEKEVNAGGCASTFKRFGKFYNTGATTFVGYEDGHIVKKQFDKIGIKPDINKSEIAIRVVQNGKTIDRIKEFDQFLENINKVYPNKNNEKFWRTIKDIDRKFWELKRINFLKYSLKNYLKTALFINELFLTFRFDLFKSAQEFIKDTLGDISLEYKRFIDAQLLITVQTTSKDISLLSMALGLAYPFHDVFYVNGGMGTIIKDIIKDVEFHKNEQIKKIKKDNKGWILISNKNEYKAKKVVLNSTIYQSSELFDDENIKNYYDGFTFSDQSAFVVYIDLKESSKTFLEHYQFIFDKILPNCTSNSFFVSFSKKEDQKLSKNGLSVTVSTHTKAYFWRYMSYIDYDKKKKETVNFIKEKFLEYFGLGEGDIKNIFGATSFTFNRYINRYNCGGKAIGFKNALELPSCNTPFKGLYNVGDTVFAGQGWPGVALGVDVLNKEINGIG